jgi:CRP-like cAMP-binding protein
MPNSSPIVNNRLLAALPEIEYQRLAEHMELVYLNLGEIIYEPNNLIKWVYFPDKSIIYIVSLLSDNSLTEIGLVGNEGMIGLSSILGGNYAIYRAIVQVAERAVRLNAKVLKKEFERGETLHKILLLYTEFRLIYISQISVCKSSHEIEKRLCRWLLTVHDCVQDDRLLLTQKFISQMLGVRRASVTEAAQKLQDLGIISYKRGTIIILNRSALEEKACECYHLIVQEYNRLL